MNTCPENHTKHKYVVWAKCGRFSMLKQVVGPGVPTAVLLAFQAPI